MRPKLAIIDRSAVGLGTVSARVFKEDIDRSVGRWPGSRLRAVLSGTSTVYVRSHRLGSDRTTVPVLPGTMVEQLLTADPLMRMRQ